MTQYLWTIDLCKRVPETGFIIEASWSCYAIDGERSGKVTGQTSFALADPQIPYDQVTEQEVLNWCWANGVDAFAIETQANEALIAAKNPTSDTGVPW